MNNDDIFPVGSKLRTKQGILVKVTGIKTVKSKNEMDVGYICKPLYSIDSNKDDEEFKNDELILATSKHPGLVLVPDDETWQLPELSLLQHITEMSEENAYLCQLDCGIFIKLLTNIQTFEVDEMQYIEVNTCSTSFDFYLKIESKSCNVDIEWAVATLEEAKALIVEECV